MDLNTVTQLAAVVLGVLAIIWHQQRTIDKLRDDFERAHSKLRDDFGRALSKLRDDFGRAIDKLRDGQDEVKQRLSRIEGFLGIGMPEAAGQEAPGAALSPDRPDPEQG